MPRFFVLLRERIKSSLWLVPVLCVLGGVALATTTIAIDRATDGELLSTSLTGDPNSALTVLATAAASMISLTALVLTITMVVVQLAMGQFSPRSVRPFLRDRPSQFAVGIFAATFAQTVLAMHEVRSFADEGSVPGVTIVTSYVLIVLSIMILIAYVHHIGHSLKVDSIIRLVGNEARSVIERLYPDGDPDERDVIGDRIMSDRTGMVIRIDHERLVLIAHDAGSVLEVTIGAGAFIAKGAPLVRVADGAHRVDAHDVRNCIAIGPERTTDQDAAFGVQTLVDVTERALTDSFNDATTANQAIDRIHECLRILVQRPFPSGTYRDVDGDVRLTVPTMTWEDYLGLTIDPILLVSAGAPRVIDRVRDALTDLEEIAPEARRAPIQSRLRQLEKASAELQRRG